MFFRATQCATPAALLLILLTLGALVLRAANPPGPAVQNKKAPGADFFSEPTIRTFRFEVPDSALNELRRKPRSYVTGKITEGNPFMFQMTASGRPSPSRSPTASPLAARGTSNAGPAFAVMSSNFPLPSLRKRMVDWR